MARPSILGAAIAADARRYEGQTYVYGGPADRPGDWDCSSYVSYVLGHDLRLGLPGGRWGDPGFPPNAHGPVVLSYVDWTGAYAVPLPSAGDLCCWAGEGPDGHIGIAIDQDHMISALNPSLGVMITPIQGTGPASAPLVYRRLRGVVGGPVFPVGGPSGGVNVPGVLAVITLAGLAALLVSIAAGLAVPLAIGLGKRAYES